MSTKFSITNFGVNGGKGVNMKNKEWLSTLDGNDCALFCLEYMPLIGRDSLSSVFAVGEWLELEYNSEYHIVKHFNDMIKLRNLTKLNRGKYE